MSDDGIVVGFAPAAPARRTLPHRRPAVTARIAVGLAAYDATLGFAIDGTVRELFLSGAKDGSDMAAVLDDAAIVISVALQHGVPPAALRRSLSRLPAEYGGGAASVIGAALDLVCAEAEGGGA